LFYPEFRNQLLAGIFMVDAQFSVENLLELAPVARASHHKNTRLRLISELLLIFVGTAVEKLAKSALFWPYLTLEFYGVKVDVGDKKWAIVEKSGKSSAGCA